VSAQTTFTVADNGDVGRNAVTAACDRWPLQRLGDGGDVPDWYDAEFSVDLEGDLAGVIAPEGTPVEVKTCRYRYDDPSGRRRGRWWIKRANHEQLLDQDGEYVLTVHDADTAEILRQGLVTATTVDAIVDGEWWACGAGGKTAEEYRQITWSAVFDDVGGEADG